MTREADLSIELNSLAEEVRRRFVERTLPIWYERGWDPVAGGCVERLDASLEIADIPFRRSMAHARLLHVFSFWGRRSAETRYAIRAAEIAKALEARFRDRAHGGWIARTDLDGRPLDTDKDFYGHAFIVFGLAHHALATGEPAILDSAIAAREWVEETFGGGQGAFVDGFDRSLAVRRAGIRQNPHMHLLEAALALLDAGDEGASSLAASLVRLFRDRFLDPRDQVIEYLGDDLEPDPTRGHRIEPGHHMEWAWLLDRQAALTGEDRLVDLAHALHDRALAIGEDPVHGGLFDEVDRTAGTILADSKRLWPVTEWIKAAVALRRRGRVDDRAVERPLRLLLDRYLHADGTWTEYLARDLTPTDLTMPASTLYHLSMAVAELDTL